MWKRILTGVLLAGITLMALLWWRQISSFFVDAIVVLFMLVATHEIYKSLKQAEYNPMIIPITLVAAMIYPLTFFLAEVGIFIAIIVGVVLALINFTFVQKFELKDLFSTVFIMIYPIGLLMMLVVFNNSVGELMAILMVILIAVLCDTMAYFTGVTFKGKKLCPSISPKKTISGAIGGLIGGIMGAVIVFLLFDQFRVFDSFKNLSMLFAFEGSLAKSLPFFMITGLVGAIMCELGDLAASRIKRAAGIKDFGRLFPGHGGVMDRLDGIIFVVPVVYFAMRLVPLL